MLKRLFVFVLLAGLISCSRSEEEGVRTFAFDQSDYEQLIIDLNTTQLAIAQNQILQRNRGNQLERIETALDRAEAGVLLLAQQGGVISVEEREAAYANFDNAVRQYEKFGVLENEQSRLDQIFDRVRLLKFRLSQDLGRPENENWVIYNHNFSTSGMEPEFETLGKKTWASNFQTDVPKASARGRRGDYTWLISRPFDLQNVEQPGFRYLSQLLVSDQSAGFDLLDQIIRDVFKTYILIDYKRGDDPEAHPEDKKILVEYDLDMMVHPSGQNFHEAWLPVVSLEEHKQKGTISIAFLFDTRKPKFEQFYVWSIFDFELSGAGELPEDPVKYSQEFVDGVLGNFNNIPLAFGSPKWFPGRRWAETPRKGKDVNTALISPKYFVPEETTAPFLIIKELFKGNQFDSYLDQMEILISQDYNGGAEEPFSSAVWKPVKRLDEFSRGFSPTGNNENIVTLDLTEYQGKEFTLAFKYNATSDQDLFWAIRSVEIQGRGGEVIEVPFQVTYQAPDPEADFIFASYDFLTQDPKDFKREKVSGENPAKYRVSISKKSGERVGINITGHRSGKDPLLGERRLILGELDLSNRLDVRLRVGYHLGFFREGSGFVQVQYKSDTSDIWTDVGFPFEQSANRFVDFAADISPSNWVLLPSDAQGQKIKLALYYKANNESKPNWTVQSVDLRRGEE